MRPAISPRSSDSERRSSTVFGPYAASRSTSSRCGKPSLQARAEARQGIGDEEVEHEQRAEHQRGGEALVVEDLAGIGELDHADLRSERRVLDEKDEEAEGGGQYDTPRLRQDHMA